MPTDPIAQVQAIRSLDDLLTHLEEERDWPLAGAQFDDATFDYDAAELGIDPAQAARVRQIKQLRPLADAQPWGVFFVEFDHRRVPVTALRRILRALVTKKRQDPARATQATWSLDNLLFVTTCGDRSRPEFAFTHFSGDTPQGAKLATFGWSPEEPCRTICEHNLPALRWPDDTRDASAWSQQWASAFDVERVTRRFFEKYRELFYWAKEQITGLPDEDTLHSFTQALFNRLLFITFIQKKRWLDDTPRYLFDRFARLEKGKSFYGDFLYWLFFWALPASPDDRTAEVDAYARATLGHVPFLNGGLFEIGEWDVRGKVKIPNEVFARTFDELLDHYNFTVTESTPLDIEVAVDPEMLGKVFEELVTGRHESGSYYTPKPVVAFMCREALKGYLRTAASPPGPLSFGKGASGEGEQGEGGAVQARALQDGDGAQVPALQDPLAAFVDHRDSAGLGNPEAVLDALKRVRAVDPACGSGAYLLGMMHELLELRACLFTAGHPDAPTVYQRKLEIIESNLYGVDIDPFAVNIARLRLWLSLAVDYEGDNPPPLPNLDFKVEVSDNLLSPSPEGLAQTAFRDELVRKYQRAKADYMTSHGARKGELYKQALALRDDVAEWTHHGESIQGFDWSVEFAEVFAADGGFDVALANPPYVRQELIGPAKPRLLQLYPEALTGKSDIYCAFYARALQLLREGGMHVFVCSNSWLDVGYGGKLQGYLLDRAHVQAVYDSAVERQFATADINTIISILQKGRPADHATTRFVSLKAPFEQAIATPGLRREIIRTRDDLWQAGLGEPDKRGARAYDGDKWGGKYLRAPDIYWRILEKGKDKLVRLGDIAEVRRGFTTGANEFFFVEVVGTEGRGVARIRAGDDSEHLIEERFVKWPVVTKTGELTEPVVVPEDLRHRIVMIDRPVGTANAHAAAYVRWGEAAPRAFHRRPTCASRVRSGRWYMLGERDVADLAVPIGHKRRPVVGVVKGAMCGDNLVEVDLEAADAVHLIGASVFSAFAMLQYELLGRANFGQGLLKTQTYEIEDLLVLNPASVSPTDRHRLEDAFLSLAIRAPLMVYDEVSRRDRVAFDGALLSAIGFSNATERDAVRQELNEATCRVVWHRMAKTDNSREARQTYDEWQATGVPFGADVEEEEGEE